MTQPILWGILGYDGHEPSRRHMRDNYTRRSGLWSWCTRRREMYSPFSGTVRGYMT